MATTSKNQDTETTKSKAVKAGKQTKAAQTKASKPVKAAVKATGKATNGNTKAKVTATNGKAKAASKPEKGEKKVRESKVVRDKFGFKEGSLKSQAAAMYASKKTKGATLAEVKEALNSSQLNLLKQLEAEGVKVNKTKEPGAGKKQVTRYYIMD